MLISVNKKWLRSNWLKWVRLQIWFFFDENGPRISGPMSRHIVLFNKSISIYQLKLRASSIVIMCLKFGPNRFGVRPKCGECRRRWRGGSGTQQGTQKVTQRSTEKDTESGVAHLPRPISSLHCFPLSNWWLPSHLPHLVSEKPQATWLSLAIFHVFIFITTRTNLTTNFFAKRTTGE